MPIIVKIGYRAFLVKNEAAALSVLKGLAGAVALESRHRRSRDNKFTEYFWPEDNGREVSMATVAPGQVVAHDPGEAVEIEAVSEVTARRVPRQLGMGGAV